MLNCNLARGTILVLALGTGGSLGCGSDSGSRTAGGAAVTVAPRAPVVGLGGTVQFAAALTGSPLTLVDWAIANDTDLGYVLEMFIAESGSGHCHPMVGDEGTRAGFGIEGERLIIDPAVDVTARGLSPTGLVIARTLQRRGCYIGDNSGGQSRLKAEQENASHPVWRGTLPEDVKKARTAFMFTVDLYERGSYGHMVYDTPRILREGLKGIKKDIEARKRDEQASAQREGILAKLVDAHSFDVPPGMVERELQSMAKSHATRMARRGVDVNNFDYSKFRDENGSLAEKRVKGILLLDAIAEKEKIELADQEVNSAIAAMARSAGQTAESVRKYYDSTEGGLDNLRASLTREKALALLLSRAKKSYN